MTVCQQQEFMNKKFFIPIGLGILLVVFVISQIIPPGKIVLEWESPTHSNVLPDSIELNVFVENSGSMDGYMCSGSNLKDAVYDYISNIKKYTTACHLYYVNSQIIQCDVSLDNYIKDLSPQSFARAGGNRGNTDLRDIFKKVLSNHAKNNVTVFVSDYILDIPQSATDYFGNCQVSIKNTFSDAIINNPNLGVQIVKLQSKFDGFWFCGHNKQLLNNTMRPYYIWIIGDKSILSMLNKKAPISNVLGGIQNYCAYSTSRDISFDITKKRYAVNHQGKILVEVLANLSGALQEETIYEDINNYNLSNPQQINIQSVKSISSKAGLYSHVLNIELMNPQNLKKVELSFSYPDLAEWVKQSNDSTGIYANSVDKTTGLLYLVQGVAGAFKDHLNYGDIEFTVKNK